MLEEDPRDLIDQALAEWRQGDCILGEETFLFRLEVPMPLTEPAIAAAAEDADAAEAAVRGLVIVTQTCDIVRECAERPFVEACPLVEVSPDSLDEIRRGRRPRYAFVPGVADLLLVADLDRVMTLEKPVIAGRARTVGCDIDDDARQLAQALARKRARFAFPTDFGAFASSFVGRALKKHNRHSDEGKAFRALREIRVRAAPSWTAPEVELTFWFILDDVDADAADKSRRYLETWLALLLPSGRFKSVYGSVVTLDDLTARDYLESDRLDLDHLSEV